MTHALRRLVGCATATILLVGCTNFDLSSHFDMKKNIPWGEGENGEAKAPIKAAAMWTDTILNQGGQASLRGFGGRVMFYAAEGGKPIKVRGTLVVYAFDETGRDTEHVRPDRKYVFTPEQFEKHYSKSALGHSYSVWLPWDEAGGPRREISLLVRFTPIDGAAIVGDLSKHNLPGYSEADVAQYPPYEGAKAGPAAATPTAPSGVTQVAYQAPLSNDARPNLQTSDSTLASNALQGMTTNEANPPRRMTTTTITLPPSQRTRGLGIGGYAGSPTGANAPVGEMPGNRLGGIASRAGTNGRENLLAANSAAATPGAPATATYSNSATSPNSAATAPASAEPQSAAHFGSPRRRPLGEPLERLTRDRAPWQPSR